MATVCQKVDRSMILQLITSADAARTSSIIKSAANNPDKSSEGACLVSSMIFSTWQDDIVDPNPSIWNIIMLLLIKERGTKVMSISIVQKYVRNFQRDIDRSMLFKRHFSDVYGPTFISYQMTQRVSSNDKSRKVVSAFEAVSHVSRRRWSRHFGHI